MVSQVSEGMISPLTKIPEASIGYFACHCARCFMSVLGLCNLRSAARSDGEDMGGGGQWGYFASSSISRSHKRQMAFLGEMERLVSTGVKAQCLVQVR